MKNVVSFSGGRTSAYMVGVLIGKFGRGNLEVIFMDTGAEHPKTYDFVKACQKLYDIKITALRTVVNSQKGKGCGWEVVDLDDCGCDLKPWQAMTDKYNLPYLGGAFCTDRMKTQPYSKYCDHKYGRGNYVTWLGIRADEAHRLKEKPNFKYLADISEATKQDIIDFWSAMEFDLGIDEHLGNCVFCIKKGHGKVALAMRDEPKLYQQFKQMVGGRDAERTMYRGKRTLADIEVEFRDMSTDDLRTKVYKNKRPEAGECTESCEVFANELVEEF